MANNTTNKPSISQMIEVIGNDSTKYAEKLCQFEVTALKSEKKIFTSVQASELLNSAKADWPQKRADKPKTANMEMAADSLRRK